MLGKINHLELSLKYQNKTRYKSLQTIQNQQQLNPKILKKQLFPELYIKTKSFDTISHQQQENKTKHKSILNPQFYSIDRNEHQKKISRNLMYYIKRHKMTQYEANQALTKQRKIQFQKCDSKTIKKEDKIQTKDFINQKRKTNFNNLFSKGQKTLINPNKSYYLKMKRIIHQNIENKKSHPKLLTLSKQNQEQDIKIQLKEKNMQIKSQRIKKYKDLSLKQLIYQQQHCLNYPLSPSLQRKAQYMRLNLKNNYQISSYLKSKDSFSKLTKIPGIKNENLNQKSNQFTKQKCQNSFLKERNDFANFIKYKKRKCKFMTNRKTSNKTQRFLQQFNS